MKRRSEIGYPSGNEVNFNLQLFEHALKHAPSRNLIMNLLASRDKSVFELFSSKALGDLVETPVKRIKKREHCESPTALLRRRELEKINRPDSAQSDSSTKSSVSGRSSTLPFEQILRNVTAFVEIRSGGNDRSGGAKALLKSMGAAVCENFSRDVTHVIFKDGSYQTYQRAKLLKVHFVSVLWLEAARRNGVRPPESNFPALGSKNYDQNVSLICSQLQKDYEDVIREEIRRTLESGSPLPTTKSLIGNRRKTVGSKQYESNSEFPNEHCSQDKEVENILQKIRGFSKSEEPKTSSMVLGSVSPTVSLNNDLSDLSREIQNRLDKSSDSFRPSSMNLEHKNSEIWTSDSECGMIDGDFSRNKKLIDETLSATPFKPKNVDNSNMDLTCSNDSENSESKSLLSNRYISRRKSRNETTHMELTNLDQTKVNTMSETPRSILKNLGQNIINSVSYIASKANLLSDGDSKKRTHDNKENHDVEDDEFYRLKTPTLIGKKRVKSNIFSNALVGNSIENVKDLSGGTSKVGLLNNQGVGDSVMSSSRISNSKQKKKSEECKRESTEMLLNISSDSKRKKRSGGNKSSSTEMSSLHISSDSKGRKISEESKRGSTEMSSLRVSTDSKKISNGTSMSSLKLCNSSTEKSSSTNMSSLRISFEKLNSKEINEEQKLHSSASSGRMREEQKAMAVNVNHKGIEEEQLLLTPFVTERRKRKSCKKSEVNDTINNDNTNFEFSKDDVHSSEKTSENVRRTRRATLALNREKSKFEVDLENRKDFHDKNREIELNFHKMNEKTNTTVDLSKTPKKSSTLQSPFVNKRSRRKSVRHGVEDEQINSYDKWNEATPIRRKSVRLEGQHHNGLIAAVIEEEKLSDLNSSETRQRLKNAKSLTKITGNCGGSENTLSKNEDILVKTPSKESNKMDTSSVLSTKKAVVILENVLVSPQKDVTPKNKPLKKSRSEAKLKVDEEHLDSLLLKNISLGNAELLDEMKKIKTQPQKKPLNVKMSRSESETNIMRRSRRIRKLYNPDESIDDGVVNDSEERDRLRQEKITRNKGLTQCSGVIGNVLLTQKAMDYLEENKNNQKELKTLFHSPETVLDQIGIDKKKKNNKKESILNRSSDEQVDLAEEFVHKKRISRKRKASQKTPRNRKSLCVLSQKSLATNKINRRSTLEFEPASLSLPKAKTKLKLDQKPTIVCTKMHRQDVQIFNQIVRKLGIFVVENEVTSKTTHLVVGEVKRTINLLRALARGCWILRQEWLLKSLEDGKWLPEDDYEVTEFSPAVQKCRLEKLAFGPSYTMNIFLNCGPVYVAKSTTPRCSDLRELILICKGKITKMPDNAVISVGMYFDECKCVSEYWILDSISAGKLKPLKKYYISKENGKSPFV